MVVIFFAKEFIIFAVVFLALFWCSCLEATLYTTIIMIVEDVFKRDFTCLPQLF